MITNSHNNQQIIPLESTCTPTIKTTPSTSSPTTKEPLAFGTRTHRFRSHIPPNNSTRPSSSSSSPPSPGPGHYYKPSSYIKDATTCGSVSVRGYTTMISQTPRFSIVKELNDACTPGPGAYNHDIMTIVKRDKQKSDRRRRPLTILKQHQQQQRKRPHSSSSSLIITPGPGHYNTNILHREQIISQHTMSSFFKSTGRPSQQNNLKHSVVAVGTYDVGKSLDALQSYGKDVRKGKPFPCPSFSSTVERSVVEGGVKTTPGPGCYDVEQQETISFQQKKPSAMFYPDDYYNQIQRHCRAESCGSGVVGQSWGDHDDNDYDDTTPGPGWYYREGGGEGAMGSTPRYSVTAPFRSELPRFGPDGGNGLAQKVPGPAYYNPKTIGDRSVYLNKGCKWI